MKKFLLFIAFAAITNSCAAPMMYQFTGACTPTSEELFKSLATVSISEGYSVKASDAKLGMLVVEKVQNDGLNNAEITNSWIFQHDAGKIVASFKRRVIVKNSFNAVLADVTAYWKDENVNPEYTFYWNVRNSIDKLCGGKMVIIEKQLTQ